MAHVFKEDLVVACLFRDCYRFWAPIIDENNEEEQKLLIGHIKASLQDCVDKQYYVENIGMGNVYARQTKEDFLEYFDNNKKFFYFNADGQFLLRTDAVKEYCGSLDLNIFFKKLIQETSIYSKHELAAFDLL